MALAVAAMLLFSRPSWGQTAWQAGTDSWFNSADWSAGEPTTSSTAGSPGYAYINDSGTAEIASGTATAYFLDLGENTSNSGSVALSAGTITTTYMNVGDTGAGMFNQTGGSDYTDLMELGASAGGTGTYVLSGTGALNGVDEAVGYIGYGIFNQTGGTNAFSSPSSVLYLGGWEGSGGGIGVYTLSAGQVTSGGGEVIGDAGTGTFAQNGGTNSFTGTAKLYVGGGPAVVSIGTGSYVLSAGLVSNSAAEIVGFLGTGSFTQSGGTNSLSTTSSGLFVGGSSFEPSHPPTNVENGNYLLTGGSLNSHFEYIGDTGQGSFNQSGGTNVCTGTINLGPSGTSSGIVYLAYAAGSTGSYSLSGTGSLTATIEDVGYQGSGSFNQSGGVNSTTVLNINSGTYDLTGGSLSLTTLALGTSATFNNNGGALSWKSLDVAVGGAIAGDGYGDADFSGTVDLAGTLTVALVNSFEPEPGEIFYIIDAGSVEGTFSTVNLPGGTSEFALSYTPTGVYLTSEIPEPGSLGILAACAIPLVARRSRKQTQRAGVRSSLCA